MSSSGAHAGMLLVATPELLDPNFSGSVVLLLDADDDGALGVILNRPSKVPVVELLDSWVEVTAAPEVLFQGGPVEGQGALAVAELTGTPADSSVHEVIEGLGLVDLSTPLADLESTLSRIRVFAGYAGWGAGQLDGEIEAGHWYVVAAAIEDVFTHDASDLWARVLRRQPGELSLHATRPPDPDLN